MACCPFGPLWVPSGNLGDSSHGHHHREGHDAEQVLVPSEEPFCSLGQVCTVMTLVSMAGTTVDLEHHVPGPMLLPWWLCSR